MKKHQKYDPEDIESLLLHKRFDELLEDEKRFVLEHIESPDEYESLRKTLSELHISTGKHRLEEPPASIREALIAEFASEKKGRFAIWLNSLFALPERSWYEQRGFTYALAVAGISAGLIFLVNRNETEMIAEVRKDQATEKNEKPGEIKSADGTLPVDTVIDVPGEKEVSAETAKILDTTTRDETLSETVAENAGEKDNEEIQTMEDMNTAAAPASDDADVASAPETFLNFSATEEETVNTGALFEVDVVSSNAASAKSIEQIQSSKTRSVNSIVVPEIPKSVRANEKKDLLDLLYTAL